MFTLQMWFFFPNDKYFAGFLLPKIIFIDRIELDLNNSQHSKFLSSKVFLDKRRGLASLKPFSVIHVSQLQPWSLK